jgi:modulator of FtsH protease
VKNSKLGFCELFIFDRRFHEPSYSGYGISAEQRHRVLRNTYGLLALSMIPTVLGAWFGVASGILSSIHPVISSVIFLAGAFGFMFAIEKTKHSVAGVYWLLGFTFFMGLMLSRLLAMTLLKQNGATLIMLSFSGTALIFLGMAALSSFIKRDLSGMGKFLFVGAVMLMVASIANIFLQSTALFAALSALAIGIFSAFILYDLKNIRDGAETNYISATLGVYLSVYNIFQSLLSLLTGFGGQD